MANRGAFDRFRGGSDDLAGGGLGHGAGCRRGARRLVEDAEGLVKPPQRQLKLEVLRRLGGWVMAETSAGN